MRVVVDLDCRKATMWFRLAYTLLKGLVLLRSLPDEIRLSSSYKGFHLIWRGLSLSREQVLDYRSRLGDDRRRVKMDRDLDYKPFQVLFRGKVIKHYQEGELKEKTTRRGRVLWKR